MGRKMISMKSIVLLVLGSVWIAAVPLHAEDFPALLYGEEWVSRNNLHRGFMVNNYSEFGFTQNQADLVQEFHINLITDGVQWFSNTAFGSNFDWRFTHLSRRDLDQQFGIVTPSQLRTALDRAGAPHEVTYTWPFAVGNIIRTEAWNESNNRNDFRFGFEYLRVWIPLTGGRQAVEEAALLQIGFRRSSVHMEEFRL